jgi:hypothetical protein
MHPVDLEERKYRTISGTSMGLSPHGRHSGAVHRQYHLCRMRQPNTCRDHHKPRSDAQSKPASYGFTNDPRSPSVNRFYGYLSYAGGY